MLELLFVLGFFMMLLVTGISLIGVFIALAAALVVMSLGGLFVMMIKLLPWLILAIVVVWVIRALNGNSSSGSNFRRDNRWRY